MKIFTKKLKAVIFFLLVGMAATTHAQNPCTANFNFNYGSNGLVTFTSTSVSSNTANPLTYYWSFGNNTTFSATGFPGMTTSTTYTTNGTYTVTLFIMQPAPPSCSAAVQMTLNITNAGGCGANANFNYTQGTNGLVNFNNTTTGTIPGTTYSWNFGDSSPASSNTSPAHTYAANGAYIATLVATNNATCVSTRTMQVIVNTYCTLNAGFTITNGNNGVVSFASTSTGTTSGTSYLWNFGDNTSSSSGPNTAHTYINGSYWVLLTVTNNSVNPGCQDTVMLPLTVTSNTCNLVAGFTHTVGTGGSVSFNSTSSGTTGATTYTWNFGNGFTSNSANPTITFASGGFYYVSLTVRNAANCVSYSTQSVNVNTIPCVANANFTLVPTGTPQFWSAIPSYPWNVSNASWSWGDASPTTNTMYAAHQYSVAGLYNICLTVTASCGATASACATYSVFRTSQPVTIINVNVASPALKNLDDQSSVGISALSGINAAYELFPNPSTGLFNLKLDGLTSDKVTISVYNTVGDLLYANTAEVTNGSFAGDVSLNNATSGIYLVQVKADGKTLTRKLVINK